MVSRPASRAVIDAQTAIGNNLTTWRKLLGLTAAQVADRAGIARGTLSHVERGDGRVGFTAFLAVAHALGQLDRLAEATDPYETDLGRARADHVLPRRVRP